MIVILILTIWLAGIIATFVIDAFFGLGDLDELMADGTIFLVAMFWPLFLIGTIIWYIIKPLFVWLQSVKSERLPKGRR